MYILTNKQIAETDKATIKNQGISSIDLMERAATLCFQWIHDKLKQNNVKIHVFCGIGNNGGDGLVIARHLYQHKYNVNCYVVNFRDKRSKEFLINYNRLKELGEWPKVISSESIFPEISKEDIVIDAIFGNGLSRKPTGFTKKLIQHINNSNAFILSIDFPSGLFGNKSVSDKFSVIKSTHILTFQTPKLAFLLPENKEYVDTWEILDIGLDTEFIKGLKPTSKFITKNDIKNLYKPRNKWDHKGTFGHSLIIAGSFGKIGASILATTSALKIGSGLVTAYIPKCGYTAVQTAIPEAMVEVDSDNELSYFNFKTIPNVIGIGPGIGTKEKTLEGFKKFISDNKKSLVIDADAINLLSANTNLLKYLPENAVLTPHPKELERLIGTWKNDFDKLKKASNFTKKYKAILVIKGAHTVIIKNKNFYFNSTGNPALATAGSGDVLTGFITGLIAQGYTPLNASIVGVYLHGKTADIALQETGYETFTASSILEYLPDAILNLFESAEVANDTNENKKL